MIPCFRHCLLGLDHELLGQTLASQHDGGLFGPVDIHLSRRELLQDLGDELLCCSALGKVLPHCLERIELALRLLQLLLQFAKISGCLLLRLGALVAPGAGLLGVEVDASFTYGLLGLLSRLLRLLHSYLDLIQVVTRCGDHLGRDDSLLHGILGCVRLRGCLRQDLCEGSQVLLLRSSLLFGVLGLCLRLPDLVELLVDRSLHGSKRSPELLELRSQFTGSPALRLHQLLHGLVQGDHRGCQDLLASLDGFRGAVSRCCLGLLNGSLGVGFCLLDGIGDGLELLLVG
mmetsp:Transcript_5307/g.12028  ORF Transcript_5307/g.12028 Transcript_5307/m.12028 type:complete len:288 (+) Transcript_5307:4580-5443(+)